MKIRLVEAPLALPRYRQVRLPTVAAELAPFAEVEINDENVEPIDFSPVDLVGFTAQPYNVGRAIHLAQRFRECGAKTVLGGPHATTMGAAMLEHFDAVVVGEVEGLGERLVRDLERGRLAGVYQNDAPPDLSRMNLPRRDLQQARHYYQHNFPMELSRGCPHRCHFCYGRYGWPGYRTVPLAHIERDLDQWDHGYVEAVDMHFAADRNHLMEVCRLFEQRRIWGWMGEATLRSMDDAPLLDAMARSGCKAVFVGMESIEEAVLAGASKGFNQVHEYRRIIRMMQDHGIFVHVGLIWGLDHAESDCFDATARFCEETGVYLASANFMTLFPGTAAHEQAREQGRLLSDDLRDHDGTRITIQPVGMSKEEIYAGARRFNERFYSFSSIFRRSLQAGSNNFAQLWGFWGFNLAYWAWFARWGQRFELRQIEWVAPPDEQHSFPWVGGRMPWFYGISHQWGRVLVAGHKAWDRAATPAGAVGTIALLAVVAVLSGLFTLGCRMVASYTWPLSFPSLLPALAVAGAAGLVSLGLVLRLWRSDLSKPMVRAGLALACSPMLAALVALPEPARFWRFLCAASLLTFGLKAWDLLSRPRDPQHSSFRVAAYLAWWPGLDFSKAFRVDHTRELLLRHWLMMAIGATRLAVAAALFPALFLLALHGETGVWSLVGLIGRLALAYLLLRGTLEYWTAYWRMAGCELPDPFGRRPFGPSPAGVWRAWNVPLHDWLKRHVYLPLGGRERPAVAILGTFLVSGLAGAALLAPVVGHLPWELPAFFLAQGGLVLLERRITDRHARRWVRRLVPALFVALFVLTAPWLFALTDRVFV